MRHLGRGIKRPIAPALEREGRETGAGLSIFNGTVKRARSLPIYLKYGPVHEPCCRYYFFISCVSLSATCIHSYRLPVTLFSTEWRGATLPSGHPRLIKEKRFLWPWHLAGSARV